MFFELSKVCRRLFVQVFLIVKEQKTFLLQKFEFICIQLGHCPASNHIQLVVHKLDHMEMIENDCGTGQILFDPQGIRSSHIHGNKLNFGLAAMQAEKERL